MLEIEEVSFAYEGGARALRDVTIHCPAGEIFAILGQSGSGKTTLLKCIGRFLEPQAGSIRLDGEDIHSLTEREFRQRLGIVFQGLHLFPHLSLLENMALAPVKALGKPRADTEEKAREMFERFGIGDILDRYPAQISGGQAQRAAIIRGLMLEPTYLLLDEPTAALDINTTDSFAEWLRELRDYTTFVVVTHDIPFATGVAGRGVVMTEGEVRAEGPVDEIMPALKEAFEMDSPAG
jgi:ABC-type polar amino acid transport system ATPase subunit